MFQMTKWIEIDAAHRVLGHEGKCNHLHGHRYRIGFVLEAMALDAVGRVVDFSFIKDQWGSWLMRHIDHGALLTIGDPLIEGLWKVDPSSKIYPIYEPTTAEGLSKHLYLVFSGHDSLVSKRVKLKAVRVYETPNSEAGYYGEAETR